MQVAPSPLMEQVYAWPDIARMIKAPPKKVVVMMMPPEVCEIAQAHSWSPKIEDGEEARAFAQFAMPKMKKFLSERRAKDMSPKKRKTVLMAWMLQWAAEFRGIYFKAVRREECAIKLSVKDLGIVVGTCDPLE